ncbi:MAG TPA: DUF805 domain-containing protein [Devosia sp.]|nr:DUF805 domain-containing protein [Devosia sp.]
MRAYFDALLRYFELSGRSSRAQYWLFELFYFMIALAAIAADYYTTHQLPDRQHPTFFIAFVVIFHIVPNVTVTVRRLHDVGKSGWWYLLSFVPVGGLFVLLWTLRRGDPGQNDYGGPATGHPAPAAAIDFEARFGRAVRVGNGVPPASTGFDPHTIATQRFI